MMRCLHGGDYIAGNAEFFSNCDKIATFLFLYNKKTLENNANSLI